MIKALVLIAIIAVVTAQSSSSGMGSSSAMGSSGMATGFTKSRTAAELDNMATQDQNQVNSGAATQVIYPGIFAEYELEKNTNTKSYTEVYVDTYDYSAAFNQLEVMVCPQLGTGSAAGTEFNLVGSINWDGGESIELNSVTCFKKTLTLTAGDSGKVMRVTTKWQQSTLSKTKVTISARVLNAQGNNYAPALILGKTTVKYEIKATFFQNFRVFTDQKVANFVIGVSSPVLSQTIQAYMYTEEISSVNAAQTGVRNVGWGVEDASATKGQICTGDTLLVKGVEENQVMYLGVKAVTDVKGVTVTYKDTLDCSSASSVSALAALVVVVAKFFF